MSIFSAGRRSGARLLLKRWRTSVFLGIVALTLIPVTGHCETFNIVDFGAVAGSEVDSGPAIRRAVDAAIKSGPHSQVVIPTGHWLLRGSSAANNNHVLIEGAQGISIIGEPGAVLVSDSPKSNFFRIIHSKDVTIRSLTLQRDPVVFSQGVVQSVDSLRQTAVFKVTAGYPALDSPLITQANYLIGFPHPETGSWGDHDAACGWYKPGDPSVCWPPKITQRRRLEDSSWELTLNTVPPPSDVGKAAVVWGWDAGYNGHAFVVSGTETLLVEDIAYYAGGAEGGFVLNAGNSGDFTFRGLTVDIRPGSGDLIAAAGGSMVFNNHIHLTLDGVTIQRVWDDAVNIGANFARIYAQEAPRILVVDGSRCDFRVGDTLAIWDWVKKRKVTQVKIADRSCKFGVSAECRLTLDQDVEVQHPGYGPTVSTNNDNDGIDRVISMQSAGRLNIINSRFQVLHARDILVKASNSVIEKSTFRDTAMTGILAGPGFYWDEGPEVHDLTIRDNTFFNVGGSNIIIQDGISSIDPVRAGIAITGNRFVDPGQFQHGIMGDQREPIFSWGRQTVGKENSILR